MGGQPTPGGLLVEVAGGLGTGILAPNVEDAGRTFSLRDAFCFMMRNGAVRVCLATGLERRGRGRGCEHHKT